MSQRLSILCLILLLSACGKWKPVSNIYDLPDAYPPNAPPEYKQGWNDGCKSGFSAYGNSYIKTFYSFEQDVQMMRNPTYYKAWSDSFHYCRAFVNRLQGGGGRKIKEGESPHIFNPCGLSFRPVYDQRDGQAVSQKGIPLGLFDALDLQGWGNNTWGADVACESDWLGRKPEGCGWMGYN